MSAETSGGEGSGSILVDVTASDAGSSQGQVEAAASEVVAASVSDEALALQDVLQGVQNDSNAEGLGAYLSFDSIGNSTVINVDTDGGGLAATIAIATLDNVTGLTLQQLLNNNDIHA